MIGRPDPDWQNAVVAVVVAANGASPSPRSCAAGARRGWPPFKVPKRFELAAELPRTGSGKLRRAELALGRDSASLLGLSPSLSSGETIARARRGSPARRERSAMSI